ncbi:protein N-lysine methyltransferase METTL21A isoform X2 [Takifugu rubripes]|uniref:protein N-lysine methyltransferase METTL21A isoform X2 n=1 Tax=Takifugu rubripes TaxID=31033 RepID=UPI000E6EA4ED|nr:protein N-lysine methyltransferase METTL21A isoform X2 [Takifugu rubripes]
MSRETKQEEPHCACVPWSVRNDCMLLLLFCSMALVPYVENSLPVLSKLHSSSAEFRFVDRDLRLAQDWKRLGVAAVVWDAAVVLCMYLELGQVDLKEKEVIELGAGTGLVGIVAALMGARATITDREPALDFLSANVKANLPADSPGSAVVSELSWGEGLDRYPAGGFDLVLGADIIYLKDTFGPLLRTLEHLCSESTLILLACKIRYQRDSDFLSLLGQRFGIQEVHYDKERDIHVYKAWKLSPVKDL